MISYAILFAFLAGAASAQTTKDAIEVNRSVIAAQRKALVAQNMALGEEESKAFWPLYDAYEAEMKKVNDRKVQLIEDYAKNVDSMDDTKSKKMLSEFIAAEKERLEVWDTYAGKLSKVLPATKVTRFFQIENKLNAIINYELAAEVPLVTEAPR